MANNFQQVDLPIAEVTEYLEGLLQQLGDDCTIDGTSTKIMISDLQTSYSNLTDNTKQAVISKTIPVVRGSKVNFINGRKYVVYSTPNDDIVSYSAKILLCNANLDVKTYNEVIDENTADILSSGEATKCVADGFLERITAKERQIDVGILHEAILRFITTVGVDIQLDDIAEFKGKRYRVIDVDDITEGLLVVQLSSVRK